MNRAFAAPVIVIVAAFLAGCGGGAPQPHRHSAAAACSDLSTWFFAQPGHNVLSGKDGAVLRRAVTEAPSGHLYRDLSTLQSDVASSAKTGALAVGSKALTETAALNAENDCQSVNPG